MRFTINHIHPTHRMSKQASRALDVIPNGRAGWGNHMSGPGTARIRHVRQLVEGQLKGQDQENPR